MATPALELIGCPGCGTLMDARRLSIDICKGVCSECVVEPRRTAAAVEAARALETFGTGRTGERAAMARCVDAETRAWRPY